MKLLHQTKLEIISPDERVASEVQNALDRKTKPRRSLGRLEELACRLASIQRSTEPRVAKKSIVIMAADHGVAKDGVSAYPQEVTVQMLLNFAGGGAAINVLARQAGAEISIVNMGTCGETPEHPAVHDRRIGPGTRNFTHGPAMSREEAVLALESGIQIVDQLVREGVSLIGLGDMGIGNTTSSAAMACALLGGSPEEFTGHGTGVDDRGYRHKVKVIQRGLDCNAPDASDALDVLSKLGGFEIAGLAGAVLGAAARRIPVLVDGLITTVAAATAVRLAPKSAAYLIASHLSPEKAHGLLLRDLKLEPLLDLNMRLGEGSGAALAIHLVEASLRILDEMSTFEDAGVSDSGA